MYNDKCYVFTRPIGHAPQSHEQLRMKTKPIQYISETYSSYFSCSVEFLSYGRKHLGGLTGILLNTLIIKIEKSYILLP